MIYKISDLFIYPTYNNPCEKDGLGFENVFHTEFGDKKLNYLLDRIDKVKKGIIKLNGKDMGYFNIILERLEYFLEDKSRIYKVNDQILVRIINNKKYLREGYHRAIALHLLDLNEIKAELTNK